MKLTRRKLAASLAASAAAAMAQTQPPPSTGAGDELQAARDRFKAAGEALAKIEIPMSAEPAFQFKP